MDTCPTKHVPTAAETDAGRSPDQKPLFWRSLEELSGTPEFENALHREFPSGASEWNDPVSRRRFLQLSAASLALAGVVGPGCFEGPTEHIVPYVNPPESIVPGKPLFFATAMPFAGYGLGLLAESHMGRPTKVEGNPDHPASLGATDTFAQASVLSLWDPDRAQAPSKLGQISAWSTFVSELRAFLTEKGANVRIRLLTEPITSPTLVAQIRRLIKKYPGTTWHQYCAVSNDNVDDGARAAFGQVVETVYHFDKADRVFTLDADVFSCGGAATVRYSRDFMSKRRFRAGEGAEGGEMNRLYAVECTPTLTGASADHRLGVKPSQMEGVARALLAAVQGQPAGSSSDAHAAWIAAAAADLVKYKGKSVVVAGEFQPAAVHALAHRINAALGAVGSTVTYHEPIAVKPEGYKDAVRSLQDFVAALDAGDTDLAVILADNPAFTAPADVDVRGALKRFSDAGAAGKDGRTGYRNLVVHVSPYRNETSLRTQWHVPESHYLESWGDVRAFDGTASVIQPLIAPLYESRSFLEVFAELLGEYDVGSMEQVAGTWREAGVGGENFDAFWRSSLQRGVIAGTAAKAIQPAIQGEAPAASGEATGLELIFRPDSRIWDGRFGNNGWLQELPRPITTLTWDNAALMSMATAVKLGLESSDKPLNSDDIHKANERVVQLRLNDRSIKAPVLVVPNHPDDCVTVHLGYGREVPVISTLQAEVPAGGFNPYPLRFSSNLWSASGLSITDTGERYELAVTQKHQVIESKELDARDIIRVQDIETARKESKGKREPVHLSLYDDWNYGYNKPGEPPRYEGQHAWAMSVDLNSCTGCGACTIACQSENNIAIVGKEQVIRSREMHWIRIDTYWRGDPKADHGAEGPYFQPMMCQHCETAPCEVVCPVGATTHSAEGINEMAYNRCVGTRYCSNNCPYKVRRFNFLQVAETAPAFQLMRNPDVTVRRRGVMEKCTFCVQRVNEARREIKKIEVQATDREGDPAAQKAAKERTDMVMRGLKTACEQACPTQAITFGDLNWKFADGKPNEVVEKREHPLKFEVLADLNTKPRTSYMTRLRNPNPAMASAGAAPAHG